ncbi:MULTISPECIES: metallophosphoesterase family protein [unclassified Alteromonas]|uniref:metallophosphoesterase family protein n=1 Tax=unclassified Alteromonas TaxID=2614992 RepID=UPI0009DF9016|nr:MULTISPECIES: metallophosphoesterase [unclassified Alteromonas]
MSKNGRRTKEIRVFNVSKLNVLSCGLLVICYFFAVISINVAAKNESQQVKIAFIADIHLHSPEGAAATLPKSALPKDPSSHAPILLRSMRSQLSSTRLFNENIMVFKEALDDVVARNIKLVALPGDFTDDGQPVNILALKEILDEYQQKYGLRFFAINGNHDPVRPFTRPGGKRDFLSREGAEISVMSPAHQDCVSGKSDFCSELLKEWGYKEIAQSLSEHGFSPSPADKLFETPFNTVDLAKRYWTWCDGDEFCVDMPDMSYLVEPVDGLWLLAIDANVYKPTGSLSNKQFDGSSNAGYDALIEYKPQLVKWIQRVVERAKENNKKLVSFSHFPMADFSDKQTDKITSFLGETAMQLTRQPSNNTTRVLEATGLKLHLGGHMHLFDISQSPDAEFTNVQVPSLAAYQPGYTIVKIDKDGETLIETVIVSDVKNFAKWFPVYENEWEYLQRSGQGLWGKENLEASSFLDFTDNHLKQIVTNRYLKEWPPELVELFSSNTIGSLVEMTPCFFNYKGKQEFEGFNAMTLIFDFYRSRNAGGLAELDVKYDFYNELAHAFDENRCEGGLPEDKWIRELKQALSMITGSILASQQDQAGIELSL